MKTNISTMPHSQVVGILQIAASHTGYRLNRLDEYCACLAILQEVINPRNMFVRGTDCTMNMHQLDKYVNLLQENLNLN